MYEHKPVLFKEALEGLDVKPDGVYVDATFGRGGHAAGILERLGGAGRLFAFDRDPEAVAHAKERFGDDKRFSITHMQFSRLEEGLATMGCVGSVDGVLLDLGVSSPQIDNPQRGFSFSHEGPLDMRMDTDGGQDALQFLRSVAERDLVRVLREYGEERFARKIASHLVQTRKRSPEVFSSGGLTSKGLADLIIEAIPFRDPNKHPATRTFQAIRIYLNRELDELRDVLPIAKSTLKVGARLCVIAFHSLEDRIVKRFMRDASRDDPVYAGLPDIPGHARATMKLVTKAVKPSRQEIEDNPRSRSAVLRVAERVL
ncbi:MAG: 16S rRNA (cytosine(1402)-N(4))-methyltransferase RsmH [Pseudomonadota bacterium]